MESETEEAETTYPDVGKPFTIGWRVRAHENKAMVGYYVEDIEVFLHKSPKSQEYELLVTDEWLREHEEGPAGKNAIYARSRIDGLQVNPEKITEHERIESVSYQ